MNFLKALLFGWLPASKIDLETAKEQIMATLQEVKDAVAAEAAEVTAKVNELMAEIQALKDQIANGTNVTPEDLDALLASVNAIFVAPPVDPVP
jgi:TRAP-type mannitol/chloroaromatic compound transport system substrate-binding protein